MKRKEFLRTSLLGAAALTAGPVLTGQLLTGCRGKAAEGETEGAAADEGRRAKPLELFVSFQERTAPGETLAERFEWMEANGVVGFEPNGGKLWERTDELKGLMARHESIKISAICAGFGGFILAEDRAVKAEFDESMRRIVVAAGELGAVGVVMVPAFNRQVPCRPHTRETRDFLTEELARLGEFALAHGTTVILEPLNRREAFYLRQVGDAAAICRDTGSAGVRCMGDFWHMSEETDDYAALMSARGYLKHVHIASRVGRVMPGEDGDADNYTAGFRALKEMNYGGYVSFECGTRGDRAVTVPAALELMRRQWNEV